MPGTPALLWADVETTGLGRQARILEVGLRVTDSDLGFLAEKCWVLPYSPSEIHYLREATQPLVREMHTASGLWAACAARWETSTYRRDLNPMDREREWHEDIAADIEGWVQLHAPGRLPLAGSSVRADREWLTEWIPGLDALLHYRIVDVSSLKILMGMWAPKRHAGAPVPAKRHRVMSDLDDSIAELAFYRSALGLTAAPAVLAV